ncbi:MAG: calcium-translocating P-type ATPase, PMCA-type, partial [Prevotellaceae bacterium]|nr:calcium-translocating P-type ATPase, PMCA-type [Prevotellaceae bacterium]
MAILDKGKNSAYFSGLDSAKVEHSRKRFGANILTPPKKKPLWKLYLEKYNDPIIKILLAAAVLSLILSLFGEGLIETLGILIAIFLATTVGFVFEIDAAKKFNILTSFNEDSPVKVKRNGTVALIPRKDVVVGDIVLLEAGDEIPADGDLLEAINLEVNESSLTGEQITAKSILSDIQQNAARTYSTYPENRVYRSTMVMNGRGVMRVTEVGGNTEIGHTASKSMEETNVDTPLNNQLKRLAKLISRWGMAISILAFVVLTIHDFIINNYWQGYTILASTQTILKYFMVAVTLIVMAVPEGLPMAITLSLALNMRRMLKSNNLVRKLHACETMGAATVICTDKTGTLTQNKMKVQEVVKVINDDELLAYAIAANTTAELDDHTGGIGNPTEVALLSWVQSLGYDYRHLRQHSEMISQLPFSTERKYMQTEVDILGHRHVFTKGAPEIIIQSCGDSDEIHSDTIVQLEDFQHRAMRTLALAVDGRLQAIFAISDPLRDDVPEAVRQCQNAGIDIKIVTGDVSATAIEIARQIGLWNDSTLDECHITGTDFAALDDEEAFGRAQKIKVMSRARPNDKQRLVQMLQKAGEVVAVTGDGTNDAPALNYAHVGLSLGSGTNVAKEASDMTLLDDSFNSIVRAVMWGRSLYRNLQRFIFFQLTVNVAALT